MWRTNIIEFFVWFRQHFNCDNNCVFPANEDYLVFSEGETGEWLNNANGSLWIEKIIVVERPEIPQTNLNELSSATSKLLAYKYDSQNILEWSEESHND